MKYLCREDKTHDRFVLEGLMVTHQSWTKVVDGEGNVVNFDPNLQLTHYRCSVCNKSYSRVKQDRMVYYYAKMIAMREHKPSDAFLTVDLTEET